MKITLSFLHGEPEVDVKFEVLDFGDESNVRTSCEFNGKEYWAYGDSLNSSLDELYKDIFKNYEPSGV